MMTTTMMLKKMKMKMKMMTSRTTIETAAAPGKPSGV